MSDIEAVILRELLLAKGDYVSGEKLAEKLDISRVSIWGRLDKLKKDGFDFEAIRNKGYRIVKQPLTLNPHLLEAYLLTTATMIPVIHLDEVDSTNSEAERQIAKGCETPLVIISNSQTKGRGRLGRAWCSESNENLYMSFIFRPNLAPERMKKFTLWIGTSICSMLNSDYDVPVEIKWPNDLICNNRKLAGMLTEARIDSDHTRDLIFGLGLNVNADSSYWSDELKPIATSLSEINGSKVNMNKLAADLIHTTTKAYEVFINNDYETEFMSSWNRYDYLAGKSVLADCHGKQIEGTALGINDDGNLLLKDSDDATQVFQAGDVSCRVS